MSDDSLELTLRSWRLVRDVGGYHVWQALNTPRAVAPSETALVLCDVWDRHWCRGATERLARLLPRLNETACAARARGILIVHAPSDTLDFYADHPARRRALNAPPIAPPPDIEHDDPPLPVQTYDPTSCDTPPDTPRRVWTRQHPAIEMDADRDVISDDGRELCAVYRQRGIRNVILMGVHANMCMLGRSFAIRQMVRWGFDTLLVRDVTDAQYSPAQWPYVSHDEGTRLVAAYIERFWCPSITSDQIVGDGPRVP